MCVCVCVYVLVLIYEKNILPEPESELLFLSILLNIMFEQLTVGVLTAEARRQKKLQHPTRPV